ncbi:hypothetical protein B0H13DRAFT_461699 [Mycena leptocephala]|nr:hypothetical protein B0H13DRAFT_461699 [Mycena leptocephala]
MASSPNPYILVPVSTVSNGDGTDTPRPAVPGDSSRTKILLRVAHQTEHDTDIDAEHRADPRTCASRARRTSAPARRCSRTKGAGATFCGAAASICCPSSRCRPLCGTGTTAAPPLGIGALGSRGAGWEPAVERGVVAAALTLPVSPASHYSDLPDVSDPSAAPIVVSKQNVMTVRTHNRRKQEATFICPVSGCGLTFTRSSNLKGHIYEVIMRRSRFCASGRGVGSGLQGSMIIKGTSSCIRIISRLRAVGVISSLRGWMR